MSYSRHYNPLYPPASRDHVSPVKRFFKSIHLPEWTTRYRFQTQLSKKNLMPSRALKNESLLGEFFLNGQHGTLPNMKPLSKFTHDGTQ